MSRYKFDEIAYNLNEKRKPTDEDRFSYIGLEHLDTGKLEVTRWGSDVPIKGEKLVMHKGDILFGRRNTYLRRVAIAPHDGLFSAHGLVFKPNEKVISPDLFPFFLASDYFMDSAIRISVGSLSPTVNWKDLRELEFELPAMEEQEHLADLFEALNNTKVAYGEQLLATDELIKSQFIEMFGSPVSFDKGLPIKTIGEVATSQLGKMLNAKNQTGNHLHYYLANRNVQWFKFDFSDFRQMDFDEKECEKFRLQEDDLLVCEGGEIGRCAVWHNEVEDCYIQNAVHRVRCNQKIITPIYLGHVLYYHAQENGFSDIVGVKVTIPHLPADKLKAVKIMIPPIEQQKQFESFVAQSDKSKFELKQSIVKIENVIKSLSEQAFA